MTPQEELAHLANVEAGRKALIASGYIATPRDPSEDTLDIYESPAKEVLWKAVDASALPDMAGQARVAPVLEQGALASVLSKEYKLDGALVKGTLGGPTVTTYLVELQKGAKASNLSSREGDLARDLGIEHVRILNSVPGYPGCVGVEVPNKVRGSVSFKDTLMALKPGTLKLPIAVGSSSTGRPLCLDLAGMPHLLVAGTTGSGKSVFLHGAICSLVSTLGPKDLQLYLVDPKRVEFKDYKPLEHVMGFAYGQEDSLGLLRGLVTAMEDRYEIFEKVGVKDICEFNEEVTTNGRQDIRLPYKVVVVDEFCDLMMGGKAGPDIEALIIRLAQKARATGIHVILATQKPTADVISKHIKANMPSRIAFRVAAGPDSRVILDAQGAEDLLGKGDMLVSTETIPITRVQGAYLDTQTIRTIVKLAEGH